MFATLLWIVDGHVNGAGAGFRVVRGRVRASANLSVNEFRSIAIAFSVYVALTNIPVGELLTGFAMRAIRTWYSGDELDHYFKMWVAVHGAPKYLAP